MLIYFKRSTFLSTNDIRETFSSFFLSILFMLASIFRSSIKTGGLKMARCFSCYTPADGK